MVSDKLTRGTCASEVREAINIGPNTAVEIVTFAGNFWSCVDRPGDVKQIVSLPSKEREGEYHFAPRFNDVLKGDLAVLQTVPHQAGVR